MWCHGVKKAFDKNPPQPLSFCVHESPNSEQWSAFCDCSDDRFDKPYSSQYRKKHEAQRTMQEERLSIRLERFSLFYSIFFDGQKKKGTPKHFSLTIYP
jgi:hypothetical protein